MYYLESFLVFEFLKNEFNLSLMDQPFMEEILQR